MNHLRDFAVHIGVAFALLLAFCLLLPSAAATVAWILQHDPAFAIATLASVAIARTRLVLWWRVIVRQQAVGAKSRHQLTRRDSL